MSIPAWFILSTAHTGAGLIILYYEASWFKCGHLHLATVIFDFEGPTVDSWTEICWKLLVISNDHILT